MPARLLDAVSVVVAMAVVGAAAAHRMGMRPTEDPAPYFAAVREAAEGVRRSELPSGWDVVESPTEDARRYLNGNVCLSRTYRHRETGVVTQMLLVHCPDVRDLLKHHPAICYPGHGLEERLRRPVDWSTGGREYHATFYQFESGAFRRGGVTQVYHFILVPDGTVEADPVTLRNRMSLRDRHYGAAHVQFVFADESVPEAVRLREIAELTAIHHELFERILRGPNSAARLTN